MSDTKRQLTFEQVEKQELLDDLAYLEKRIIGLEAEIERLKSIVVTRDETIRDLQDDGRTDAR